MIKRGGEEVFTIVDPSLDPSLDSEVSENFQKVERYGSKNLKKWIFVEFDNNLMPSRYISNIRFREVSPDLKLSIPREITDKFGWGPDTEFWMDVLDDGLKQIIVGEKFRGENAERALTRLEELLEDDPN